MSDAPTTTPIPLSGLTRACRLAEGGMGRVDLAIKRVGTFRRMYAVKRLHPHLATDPDFRQMFLDEARVAGLIRHPNVVGVLDVGEDDHGPFLVMDYVDGLPLGNLLRMAARQAEPMPVEVAVRIALDVARGLHAAHELQIDGERIGLVHRDLSPQNVMVGFDGQARLTDFGIAKALGQGTRTATGVVKGKTSYLAPEQIEFEEPDRRSDLFSLGIVLHEMLSGERLYRRGGASDDMRAILDEPAPDIGESRADVPPLLVQLLFELLAKSRDARPPTARVVADRLEAVLADLITRDAATGVAEYVERIAGDARKEQSRVIASAIAEAERSAAQASAPQGSTVSPLAVEPVPALPKSPVRAWIAATLVVLVLGAGALGIAWSMRVPAPPAVVTDDASERTGAVAPPPEQPLVEGESTPADAVPVLPGGEVAEEAAVTDERPTRRHRVRRDRTEATTERTGEPLPGWVEFE